MMSDPVYDLSCLLAWLGSPFGLFLAWIYGGITVPKWFAHYIVRQFIFNPGSTNWYYSLWDNRTQRGRKQKWRSISGCHPLGELTTYIRIILRLTLFDPGKNLDYVQGKSAGPENEIPLHIVIFSTSEHLCVMKLRTWRLCVILLQ